MAQGAAGVKEVTEEGAKVKVEITERVAVRAPVTGVEHTRRRSYR